MTGKHSLRTSDQTEKSSKAATNDAHSNTHAMIQQSLNIEKK